MNFRQSLLMFCIAVAVAVAVVPVFAADPANLNIHIGIEPPNLDQHSIFRDETIPLMNLLFEGLVRSDGKGGYVPGMAEKWEASADGLEYTFTIRKGATWSNGDPVTAADFVYGLRRALDPATASMYSYILYPFRNAQAVNEGELPAEMVGVRAEGDKVTYTLEHPTSYILSILAMPFAMPGNRDFIEPLGGDYASDANLLVSNGPYTLKEWRHSDRLVLAKNPRYWNAEDIKLDTITVYVISDSDDAVDLFLEKELDLVDVPDHYLGDFEARGLAGPAYSDGAVFYLEFNIRDPVLSNSKIRKAIAYALDREALVRDVLANGSLPAMSVVAPSISSGAGGFYRDLVPQHFNDHDVAAAKALLAEAMLELGVERLPPLTLISDDGDRMKNISTLIQRMVRSSLGIDVRIQSLPFRERLERMYDGDFQIILAGLGPDYDDPMTYLEQWSTGGLFNFSGYVSAEYDRLIGLASAEADPEERLAHLEAAESLLMEDMPIAPVYFRMRNWAHQADVTGIVRRSLWPDPDLYRAEKTRK
ncbi:MAG: peptide ABC transporter substrate-binding protein [Spirochaetales bacterium]|nr:peptide ABC transporter substrate-binding protein [Spirochaetales bacterium]